MNARLGLLAASLLGLATLADATGASSQANAALDTPRVFDGAARRAPGDGVYAADLRRGDGGPENVAEEEAARARLRGQPIQPPAPTRRPLTAWNPLLNGAKGALLIGIVGFVLGGPLGLLVGAAVGGIAAWGMSKVGGA